MCGIAGVWGTGGTNKDGEQRVATMLRTMRHRGPDGAGQWASADATLNLGHVRLAVQDLSPLGCQPMVSAAGRYVITFNGEIYNFRELSEYLLARGATFKGHSDTEVMLAAFDRWGIEEAVR